MKGKSILLSSLRKTGHGGAHLIPWQVKARIAEIQSHPAR